MLCIHSFFSDFRKQNDATTAVHRKTSIELLKNRQLIFSYLSTIWESTDGCNERCICGTALYLLLMLKHANNIIIYRVIGEPVHMGERLFMM